MDYCVRLYNTDKIYKVIRTGISDTSQAETFRRASQLRCSREPNGFFVLPVRGTKKQKS